MAFLTKVAAFWKSLLPICIFKSDTFILVKMCLGFFLADFNVMQLINSVLQHASVKGKLNSSAM